MTDEDRLDIVEDIRVGNNELWMDILRLALKYAPGQTKVLLSQINHNDKRIGTFLTEIAKS